MATDRTRKRLSDHRPEWPRRPPDPSLEETNRILVETIPDFLNRKLWTNNQRRRYERAWVRIEKEERVKRAEKRAKSDAEIFRMTRRARHHKVVKKFQREENRAAKDERKARGIKRNRIAKEHNEAVRGCLFDGLETTTQIAKKLGLEVKMVRRALRRLINLGQATKLSAKTYGLALKRKRKRLTQ